MFVRSQMILKQLMFLPWCVNLNFHEKNYQPDIFMDYINCYQFWPLLVYIKQYTVPLMKFIFLREKREADSGVNIYRPVMFFLLYQTV